jgi:hypothetical protein
MIYSKHIRGQQDIANAFNTYFSSVIDKISENNVDNKINNEILVLFIII